MRAYIVTMTIIDIDDIGPEEAQIVVENTRYPNRCINPDVREIRTFDVGEWGDDHPLNKRGTDVIAWLTTHATEVKRA